MQGIRGKDTGIEVQLRKALWHRGYRYRKNVKDLPGCPDIVLTKYKIAIFCDGEFFHGKDWEVLKPRLEHSQNSAYWIAKISRNRERDDAVNKQLQFMGWTVIRFWGKEISRHPEACVRAIEETIWDIAMAAEEPAVEEMGEEEPAVEEMGWEESAMGEEESGQEEPMMGE